MSKSAWFWVVIGLLYFMLPLAATAEFSLKDGDSYSFAAYREILDDPQFRDTFFLSLKLAAATIVAMASFNERKNVSRNCGSLKISR